MLEVVGGDLAPLRSWCRGGVSCVFVYSLWARKLEVVVSLE